MRSVQFTADSAAVSTWAWQSGEASALARSDQHLALTLRLTLLLALTYGGGGSATLQVPVRVLAGAMLLLPEASQRSILWWALGTALAINTAVHWYVTDNHAFLITYWALGCATVLTQDRPTDRLQSLARVLIGLVFAWAVLWKVAAGQYVDGRFVYVTLLIDGRLQDVGAVIAGWRVADAIQVREALGFLGASGLTGVHVGIDAPTRLRTAATLLSWAALAIEACAAVLYLVAKDGWRRVRQVVLVMFCVGTYYLMPVPGFAFILVTLGFAECDPEDVRGKTVYLCVLAALQLMVLPWKSVLAQLAGAQ